MSFDYPVKYINEQPPNKAEDIPEFLDRELRRISFSIFALAEGFFGKIHVEPVKKRDGMVVYADGTDFNPGAGEGIYARIAGAWVRVTLDGLPLSGGQMTGNITMIGAQTVDGRDLSMDGAKLDLLTNKNAVINGDFNIWQRGTSFTAVANGTYTTDRWVYATVGAGVVTITRDTDTKDGLSEFSFKIDVTTADATLAATDAYHFNQRIEGFNTIPFGFGSADARQITVSFNVKSAKTGIHSVSFRNSVGNRSYIAEYTVNAANTWESKSVTLTGDTAGTWLKDTGIGILLGFALASGADNDTTPGTWQAGNFIASTNQVNVMDNVANNFFIDQVQLELGNVATEFEQRLHGQKLENCKRYYERITSTATNNYCIGQCISTTLVRAVLPFVEKRVVPTFADSAAGDFEVTQANNTTQAVTVLTVSNLNTKSMALLITVAANLVAGNATRVKDDGGNNSFIEINAEL